MPLSLQQQLGELADGNFVERGVNVLAFGLPGTGKTHALCAVGHRLVESGRSVLFAPAYRLVQSLPRPPPGQALHQAGPRSLAGKPLAGFCATPIRRIPVLCGTVVHVLR